MKVTDIALLLVALLLVGCSLPTIGHSGHAESSGHDHDEEGEQIVRVTRSGPVAELYAEFPPLVAGERSQLEAHLTLADSWSPLTEGKVTVHLGDDRFEVIKPVEPGIFRPVLIPKHAGRAQMKLEVTFGERAETYDFGEVEVYSSREEARVGGFGDRELDGGVSVSKEQQWRSEFSVGVAAVGTIQPTRRMYGRLKAAAQSSMVISAPSGGVVTSENVPSVGEEVEKNALLVAIAPRLAELGGVGPASLRGAVKAAESEISFRKSELQRLESLLAAGAVAKARVNEARHALKQARISLNEARSRARERSRGKGGSGADFEVKAPLAGLVTAANVVPGASVESGQTLFEIVDPSQIWVEVGVPEYWLGELAESPGGWIEIDGLSERIEVSAEQRLGTAGAIDPHTRTAPLIFALDTSGASPNAIRPAMFAIVYLASGAPTQALRVPYESVVVDGAESIVFVRRGGETFERRVVITGRRDGDWLEIADGLDSGEAVVTKGTWIVHLAKSGGDEEDGHGHPHPH